MADLFNTGTTPNSSTDLGTTGTAQQIAQSFTVTGASGPLVRLTASLGKTNSPTDGVVCNIYAVDGSGFPTGSSLGASSNTIDASALAAGSPTSCTFTLSTSSLTNGTKYAAVFTRTGALHATNIFSIWGVVASSYAGGTAMNYNGSAWGNLNVDYAIVGADANPLPVTITGISTAVAPVGPFKVSAGTYTVAALDTGAIVTNSNAISGNGVTTAYGQGLTNPNASSLVISSVVVLMWKSGSPSDNVYMEITQTDINGTVLATSSNVAASTITATSLATAQLVTFTFASPPTIAASATFAIRLWRTGSGDGSNYINVTTQATGAYSGGSLYNWNGSTWGSLANDMKVVVYSPITLATDAYYFFARDGTTATTLQAYKATSAGQIYNIATAASSSAAFGSVNASRVYQTFTTGASDLTVTSVRLALRKDGTPTDNLAVDIYLFDTGTNQPTGSSLGTSAVIAGSTLTGSMVRYTFTFTTPVSITPNTKYAAVISRSGADDGTNRYRTYGGNTDADANQGQAAYSNTSSAWLTYDPLDWDLLVNGTFVAQPETSWSSIATRTGFTTAILNIAGARPYSGPTIVVADKTTTSVASFIASNASTNVIAGQTFVAASTYSLSDIGMMLGSGIQGNVLNTYVEIRTGSTTGTVLGTSDAVASTPTNTTAAEVLYHFSSPVSLSSGNTYAFVFYYPNPGGFAVRLYGNTTSDYAGGVAYGIGNSTDPSTLTVRVAAPFDWAANFYAATTIAESPVIHLAVMDGTIPSSVATKYLSFDATTDTFLAATETVGAATPLSTPSLTSVGCSVVVRSNGNAVIFYNGAYTKTSGTFYARVYYRERTGLNTYGTAVEVDAVPAFDTSYPVMTLGASDRVHFLFSANSVISSRSLSSANVLDTAQAFPTGNTAFRAGLIGYDAAGTTRLVAGRVTGGTTITASYADSAANATWTQATVETGQLNSSPVRTFNDNTDVYVIYVDASNDLYVEKSTNNGATWSGKTLALTGTIVATAGNHEVSCNGRIYQRGSNVVIPYIVNDNGTLKYNEYTVRTTAPPAAVLVAGTGAVTVAGQPVMLARTRAPMLAATGAVTVAGQAVILGRGYNMVAATGAVAISGKAVTLARSRVMPAAKGAVVVAGQDVTLAKSTPSRVMPAATGAVALAGQVVTLRVTRKLIAGTGAVALAGQPVGLQYGRKLAAGTGAVVIAGQPVELPKGTSVTHYTMPAATGAVVAAGQAITFKYGRGISAATGAVTLAGNAAALRAARKLIAGTGAVTITGQSVTLVFADNAVIVAATGAVALAGQPVILRIARKLIAGTGAVALAGQPVGLRAGRNLVASTGAVTVAGQPVNLSRSRVMPAAKGAVAVAGQPVGLKVGRNLVAGTGAVALAGQPVVLRTGRNLIAAKGAVAVAGQPVNLPRSRVMPAATRAITIAGQAVNLRYSADQNTNMLAATGVITVAGQAVTLRAARIMTAAKGAVALAGQPVGLRVGRNLIAAKGAVAVAGQPVGLRVGFKLAAGTGAVTLAGQPITFRYTRVMPAGTGAVAISGKAATLIFVDNKVMGAATGNVSIAGQSVTLRYAHRLIAGTGAVTSTGNAVILRAARRMTAATRNVAIAGQPVNLTVVLSGIRPALFVNANTFYTHVVTSSRTLTPARYNDPDTFYTHALTSTYTLTPALYVNPDTFYPHVVTAFQGVFPALFVNTNTFYTHYISFKQFLTPQLYVDPDFFPQGLISVFYGDTEAIRAPYEDRGMHASAEYRAMRTAKEYRAMEVLQTEQAMNSQPRRRA